MPTKGIANETGVAPIVLLDRETWRNSAETAFKTAQATGQPLSLLFIDLNHFKDVNDTLGHSVGDEVLGEIQTLVKLLEGKLRIRDTAERPKEDRDQLSVNPIKPPDSTYLQDHGIDPKLFAIEGGRIGGDEFALICKADKAGAKSVAQRLRDVFNAYLEQPKNHWLKEIGIGISIGIGVFDPEMSDYSELLAKADQAMYEDKRDQLPPLTKEQEQFLLDIEAGLKDHNIRLRDVGRYLLLLANKA